jgi:hypothetical protein
LLVPRCTAALRRKVSLAVRPWEPAEPARSPTPGAPTRAASIDEGAKVCYLWHERCLSMTNVETLSVALTPNMADLVRRAVLSGGGRR